MGALKTEKRVKMELTQSGIGAVSDSRSILYISTDILFIFLLIGLVRISNSTWVYIFSFFLMPRFQKGLAILGHDGVHNLLFTSKKVNDYVCQYVLAALLFRDYFSYKRNHLLHHQYTQTRLDPDYTEFLSGGDRKKKLWKYIILSVAGIMFLSSIVQLLKQVWRSNQTPKRCGHSYHIVASIIMAQSLMAAYCYVIGDIILYFTIWLLPLVSLNSLFSFIRQISEHVNLPGGPPNVRSSRNIFNPIEVFFLAPHNANYHIEHHMFPYLPFVDLPKKSRELNIPPENIYKSYFFVLRELVK